MSSEIPLFIIGFALNSLSGLPNRYTGKLFRGNQDFASTFYLWAGGIGLFLTIGDLPQFLKENNISYYWFFLPFGIAVTVWVIKSWNDRIHGIYSAYYWFFFIIVCLIVTMIGAWVLVYSVLLPLSVPTHR